MRIGILVDSTCDLPEADFAQHNIRVMPISIRLGDELLVDERDAAATQHFYAEQIDTKGWMQNRSRTPPSKFRPYSLSAW